MQNRTVCRSGLAALGLVALTVGALAANSPVAAAEGYPATAPAVPPPGAYPTVVVSRTIGEAGGTITGSFHDERLTLTVPARALPDDAQITIAAANDMAIRAYLPSDEALVTSYAIDWMDLVGTRTPAQAPLQFLIAKRRISPSDSAFQSTATGFVEASPPDAVLEAGRAIVTITHPSGVAIVTHSGRAEDAAASALSPP